MRNVRIYGGLSKSGFTRFIHSDKHPQNVFFFNIKELSKPIGVTKTSYSQIICASWSVRNNSPDKRGFALLISFSNVSKSRVISDAMTKNGFTAEILLVNGKGDSSG